MAEADRPAGLWVALLALGIVVACSHEPEDKSGAAPPSSLPGTLRLQTALGTVRCTLFPKRAPGAVALLAGLAEGTTAHRDPRSGRMQKGRYYDGLTFFRRVPGVMVQTGCPLGDGTGHPGFRIAAELHDDDTALLQEPGALVMARYRTPPNRADPSPPPPGMVIGSQFGVTLRAMPQLAGQLPVVGRCQDLQVLDALSRAGAVPVLQRLIVGRAQ